MIGSIERLQRGRWPGLHRPDRCWQAGSWRTACGECQSYDRELGDTHRSGLLPSPHRVRNGCVQGRRLVRPDAEALAASKAELDGVEAGDVPQPTSRNEA
jgi:hypothetical protein